MAQFNVYGLSRMIEQLGRLEEVGEVIPEMLDAGMNVLQPEVVVEANKHRDSGEMADSIRPTRINHDGSGYYVCTRPTGKDKKGVRNMEKMAWLEYGVKGRAATPVITRAVLRAETGTIKAMREVFERRVIRM